MLQILAGKTQRIAMTDATISASATGREVALVAEAIASDHVIGIAVRSAIAHANGLESVLGIGVVVTARSRGTSVIEDQLVVKTSALRHPLRVV